MKTLFRTARTHSWTSLREIPAATPTAGRTQRGSCPAPQAGIDIESDHGDGEQHEAGTDQVQQSDCGKAVRRSKALRVQRNLEQAAAAAKRLNIGAPSLTGNEQGTDKTGDAKS